MNTRKRKRKYRLKSSFKRFLVVLLFLVCVTLYTIKEAKGLYAHYEYLDSLEYKLLEVGYNNDEINIISTLPQDKIDFFLNNEYNEIYCNIVSQDYYLDKYFYEYIDYKKKYYKKDYEDIIKLVNVRAYKGWYNETYNADLSKGYEMLVNKFYGLDSNYVRDDLVNINLKYAYANQKAAQEVVDAYDEMWNDVKDELNVHLMVNSSYRSFHDQMDIYEDYKHISLKYADSYAARPGYSEHQTGLAIDITSLEHPSVDKFTASEEYVWLKNNCYKYGFILRYPEGQDSVTGYSTESWHFRYVGKDLAKKIFDEGITFDEYYAYYMEK